MANGRLSVCPLAKRNHKTAGEDKHPPAGGHCRCNARESRGTPCSPPESHPACQSAKTTRPARGHVLNKEVCSPTGSLGTGEGGRAAGRDRARDGARQGARGQQQVRRRTPTWRSKTPGVRILDEVGEGERATGVPRPEGGAGGGKRGERRLHRAAPTRVSASARLFLRVPRLPAEPTSHDGTINTRHQAYRHR